MKIDPKAQEIPVNEKAKVKRLYEKAKQATEEMLPRLCKDCKYYRGPRPVSPVECLHAVCTHPNRTEIDLVTGEKIHIPAYKARRNTGTSSCGPKGLDFERKMTLKEGLLAFSAQFSMRKDRRES